MAVSSSAETDEGANPEGSGSNLDQAIQVCDFPIAVVEYPGGIVRLANQALGDLMGVPVEELAGRRAVDLVQPRQFVETIQTAFGSMAVDTVQADRRIPRPDGSSVPVRFWSRAVHVNGLRMAVSLIIPIAEIGRIGRDPAAPWRDLAPIAVGTMDGQWRIDRVSRDVLEITGVDPAEYAGASLLSMLHPDDAERLTEATWKPGTTVAACGRLRIRNREGTWTRICLLIGPLAGAEEKRSAFALISAPDHNPEWLEARVFELERRLRHIGAEVRASGLLDVMDSLPSLGDSDHHLAELTSRQWDILSRLLRGDRVVTIASELYLSQSTVRNHLAVIFRKFGVHSQSELLETVRRRSGRPPV